jgi:UDP-N-acetylglucosamine 2-epimerase (non-hydrolysing)
MAPVVRSLAQAEDIDSIVCVTGQHQTMLQQVLNLFQIRADYNLALMAPNQTLNGLSSKIFHTLDPVLQATSPDLVLVHGDTTSAMAGALGAFHRQIPVAHVEAGLRTGDMSQPWPEEMNRRVVDAVSELLFAPTASSRGNLESENLAGRIYVTGNTVIDALRLTDQRIREDAGLCATLDAAFPFLDPDRKLLLVTGHRRENFGSGFENICCALAKLAQRDDIQIVYPVHLNPNVQRPVNALLGAYPNVHLIAPQDYLYFVRLMQRSHAILTDSGGVQEEAPYLGKPVLVMREVTERPEAVEAGTVRLVGTDAVRIVAAVESLYDDFAEWERFSQRVNPYGDGFASGRIVAAIRGEPFTEFIAGSGDEDAALLVA